MIQAEAAERSMFARRAVFAVLFLVTMAGSLWLAAVALTPGGFGILNLAALVLFAVTLPWMVAGFSNAVIGFIIMRFSADPVAAVLPAAELIRDDEPVTASTAILLCVRNELPPRIIRNLEPMLEESTLPATVSASTFTSSAIPTMPILRSGKKRFFPN